MWFALRDADKMVRVFRVEGIERKGAEEMMRFT